VWKQGDFVPRKFLYVVKEDGSLVLAKRPLGGDYGHIDLAKGQPVLGAGEGTATYGKIEIDNASGHYLPQGTAPQTEAIKAFENEGFNTPKYIEKVYDYELGRWVKKQ
jgi:hypothetical protein